jgi:hypothetical protein
MRDKMNKNNGIILSLFTIGITIAAIYFNWTEFFMGDSATIFNLIVSISFLLLWLLFSLYKGLVKEKVYIRFIRIYWGINIISFILIWIVLQGSSSGVYLLPFSIWYGSPLYGFTYILKSSVSNFVLITASLGFIISSIGYWIGFKIFN